MADGTKSGEAFEHHAGEAPAFWYRGGLWNVLMSANETLGEFTLLDQIIPSGLGPPAHVHERQAEGFFIISGEMEVVIGGGDYGEERVVRGEAGSALWVPKSTRHAFRVVSKQDARVLNFYTPGGFDDHLPFYGEEATEQTLPPADVANQLDRERLGTSTEQREAYLQRRADIAEGTWDFTIADPYQH